MKIGRLMMAALLLGLIMAGPLWAESAATDAAGKTTVSSRATLSHNTIGPGESVNFTNCRVFAAAAPKAQTVPPNTTARVFISPQQAGDPYGTRTLK